MSQDELTGWRLSMLEQNVEKLVAVADERDKKGIALETEQESQCERIKVLETEIKSANTWTRGLLASLVISLLMLIISLYQQLAKKS